MTDLQLVFSRINGRVRLCMLGLIVSLGMPYGSFMGAGTVLPGWPAPMSCVNVTSWDGWMSSECTWGVGGMPMYLPGGMSSIYGVGHPARFVIFGAIALLLLGAWRNIPGGYVRLTGLFILVMTTITSGLGFYTVGSSLAWIVALALIADDFMRRGLSARQGLEEILKHPGR